MEDVAPLEPAPHGLLILPIAGRLHSFMPSVPTPDISVAEVCHQMHTSASENPSIVRHSQAYDCTTMGGEFTNERVSGTACHHTDVQLG
jgi:hypothetical protein